MRFVIFQVNAYLPINQLKKYFYTKHLTLLLYFKKKICALHHRIVSKHPLFIPFLLVLTVCYISYKYQPPNNWAKHQYFYIRDFLSLLHFEKKNLIFQVTADFLINQLQNIFTTGTLYSFFISKRKLRSPSENRSFYHISYYFKSEWSL